MNIRGKSVGEDIEVMVTCPDDGKTQVSASINIDSIKVQKSDEHEKDIKLDDTYTLRMRYPSLNEFIKNNFATTSYFTPDFLKRKTWISTQDGTPLEIETRRLKNKKVIFNDKTYSVKEWEISGDLDLTLQYDEKNNWVGSSFTVGNYPAKFTLNNRKNNIHKIWKSS